MISDNVILNWVRDGPHGQFRPKMTEKSQNYRIYMHSIFVSASMTKFMKISVSKFKFHDFHEKIGEIFTQNIT